MPFKADLITLDLISSLDLLRINILPIFMVRREVIIWSGKKKMQSLKMHIVMEGIFYNIIETLHSTTNNRVNVSHG